jgi:hypothetical protein
MAVSNSINEQTTGICGFNATAFVGSPATQHCVQIGGATTSTLVSVTNGTSGEVLTANTGAAPTWQAAGGGGLLSVSWSLTSAQIKALHGTPIQVIAAPGSGKVICLVSTVYSKFTYGGSNVFVAGAGQTVELYYGTTATTGAVMANATITLSSTVLTRLSVSGVAAGAFTSFDNLALNLYNPSVTEITGNAANNNTMSGTIIYYVVTL